MPGMTPKNLDRTHGETVVKHMPVGPPHSGTTCIEDTWVLQKDFTLRLPSCGNTAIYYSSLLWYLNIDPYCGNFNQTPLLTRTQTRHACVALTMLGSTVSMLANAPAVKVMAAFSWRTTPLSPEPTPQALNPKLLSPQTLSP